MNRETTTIIDSHTDTKTINLLDKCEAMSLLCSRATAHWSLIKFIFQIPLILTSSIMCILNSFENGEKNIMKIPNVVVNGTSVLILALQNNLKVPEKVELFKNLSNQFLVLAHSIEAIEPCDISREIINNMTEKYDSLIIQCLFEDIPKKYINEIVEIFENRTLPIQLNTIKKKKRYSNSSSNSSISYKDNNIISSFEYNNKKKNDIENNIGMA